MIELTPSTLITPLTVAITMLEPCMIRGPVGVGKSDIVQGIADSLGVPLVDVRLATLDPTELRGFPVPDREANAMRYLPASFLPRAPKTKTKAPNPYGVRGILFLDELNSAPPMTQAATYQLMLNRRIGEYELPDGWAMVAAGNRSTDRSIVQQTPAALNNRMMHFSVRPDLDDFISYARKHSVDSDVIGFLKFKTDLLHKFDPAVNPEAFPTPRAWMKVNRIISRADDMPTSTLQELVTATIGQGPAVDFVTFRELRKDMPTVDEVMTDPSGARLPPMNKPGAMYALVTALTNKINRKTFDPAMTYMERLPAEWQAFFVRDAVAVSQEVTYARGFTTWAARNTAFNL